ncbi:dihydrofolate reductase [Patescibacteria group bacterium]
MIKKPIYICVAVDENFGIGKDGKLPWRIHKEIQFFKELTTQTEDPHKQNMVIMGRKTWESIPHKFRPLPNRKNVVLTRKKDLVLKGAEVVNSLDQAFDCADEKIEKIYIIGGSEIFRQALEHDHLTGLYVTEIENCYECDTFLPKIPQEYSQKKLIGEDCEDGIDFKYYLYKSSSKARTISPF